MFESAIFKYLLFHSDLYYHLFLAQTRNNIYFHYLFISSPVLQASHTHKDKSPNGVSKTKSGCVMYIMKMLKDNNILRWLVMNFLSFLIFFFNLRSPFPSSSLVFILFPSCVFLMFTQLWIINSNNFFPRINKTLVILYCFETESAKQGLDFNFKPKRFNTILIWGSPASLLSALRVLLLVLLLLLFSCLFFHVKR